MKPMTPDEALENIEQLFGNKKGYCRYCNTNNAVVKGECQECGAGSYLMPEVEHE